MVAMVHRIWVEWVDIKKVGSRQFSVGSFKIRIPLAVKQEGFFCKV